MTSTANTGASSSHIIVSSRQTRFHIQAPVYQELDIQNLSIAIASGARDTASKSKGKSRSDGLEILSGATLKLKPGVHYALVGRNGTGKSTILRAISEKLIPDIPFATRIASLQQTSVSEDLDDDTPAQGWVLSPIKPRSVLEEVIERTLSRDDIQREIDCLSTAIDNKVDTYAALRAVRHVRHERLKKELFEVDKNARLRSGARGWDARKVLTAYEKKMEDSIKHMAREEISKANESRLSQQDDEISPEDLSEETEAALNLLTDLQAQIEPTRIANIESSARRVLKGLGFRKEDLEKPLNALSGGWRMRFILASTLLQESDILILDEPTNFLDLLGILWLQHYLVDLKTTSQATVIVVSHDRDFVDTVCDEIIILRDQRLTYFRGNITAYEKETRSKKLYLGRMKETQERQKAVMEKSIRETIKSGKATGDDNKLRQAKSRQKKLDDRMGMQVSAKGTRFKLNRDRAGEYGLTARAEIEVPVDEKGVSLFIPDAPDLRFPGPLVSLENVSFKYANPKPFSLPVVQDVNLVVYMGDRIGIVGLNGCGKPTVIKLITDAIKPTLGTVSRHPRLRLGYYSQHEIESLQARGLAEPSLTALSLLTRDVAGELTEADLRGLLGSLGLPGRTASNVPLAKLSGGQLVRIALAMILWRSPQLLVLDEITTHLDYHTVSALSLALSTWNGAVVIVSHDRFLIRRVVEGEVPPEWEGDTDDEPLEDEEEQELKRRRAAYLLRDSKMSLLQGGVGEFERSLEKQIVKLEAI